MPPLPTELVAADVRRLISKAKRGFGDAEQWIQEPPYVGCYLSQLLQLHREHRRAPPDAVAVRRDNQLERFIRLRLDGHGIQNSGTN